VNTTDLPPFLLLNASMDMGLDENGQLMAAALSVHTKVSYKVLQNTNHASICWNVETGKIVKRFILENCSKRWGLRGKKDILS